MHPYLINTGSIRIPSYGFLIMIGIVVGSIVAGIRSNYYRKHYLNLKNKLIDNSQLIDVILIITLFGFLGGKVLYLLTNMNFLSHNYKVVFSTPQSALDYLSDGFVVYGGFISSIIAGYIYTKKKGLDLLINFDLIAPSISIAQGFGRMGCLMAGCCYGKPTNHGFAMVFNDPASLAPKHIPLIPTQLYSSLGDFSIAIILLLLSLKVKKKGIISASFLLLYGVGRFIIEFYRGDKIRGHIGLLSTSQFISIFTVIAALLIYFYSFRKDDNIWNDSSNKA